MEPRLAPNVHWFPFLYLFSIFSRITVAPLPLGWPRVCICVSWGCCTVNTDRLLMAFECLIFLKLSKGSKGESESASRISSQPVGVLWSDLAIYKVHG